MSSRMWAGRLRWSEAAGASTGIPGERGDDDDVVLFRSLSGNVMIENHLVYGA